MGTTFKRRVNGRGGRSQFNRHRRGGGLTRPDTRRLTARIQRAERITSQIVRSTETKSLRTYDPDDIVLEYLSTNTLISHSSPLWYGVLLNGVQQGTGDQQRIGNEWTEKSLLIQYCPHIDPANPLSPANNEFYKIVVRVIILRFPTVPIGATAPPVPYEFMECIAEDIVPDLNLIGPFKESERKNLDVLYDKTHYLDRRNNPAEYVAEKIRLNNFKCVSTNTAPTQYSSMERGPIVMYAFTNLTGLTTHMLMSWKLNFIDS